MEDSFSFFFYSFPPPRTGECLDKWSFRDPQGKKVSWIPDAGSDFLVLEKKNLYPSAISPRNIPTKDPFRDSLPKKQFPPCPFLFPFTETHYNPSLHPQTHPLSPPPSFPITPSPTPTSGTPPSLYPSLSTLSSTLPFFQPPRRPSSIRLPLPPFSLPVPIVT